MNSAFRNNLVLSNLDIYQESKFINWHRLTEQEYSYTV